MRWLCAMLGYLTGKSKVMCRACRHLDAEGKCYGHPMPPEILDKPIACGFWLAK